MEHFEDEISSVDDETTSLFNNESSFEKKSDEYNNHDLDDDMEDTRSELKFDRALETEEETEKRLLIEEALNNEYTTINTWKKFALTEYGLVADDLRCKVWPLLLEVDPTSNEKIPSLEELSSHSEYQQVVLDVNRSLKRFPPGIPYKQRLALQDQLTVLILRVIIKYPHLRYYQGYHDVAITFLLVVGEVVAFRIMENLSTTHLRDCMEPTMEKTSYRLNYIYALLSKVDHDLYNFLDSASVGTMFALPWYLTWFGHSLNQYKDVVRLYDFFLASPQDMSLYVSASLVIHRRQEVFAEGCDMASIHCLLSQIPDNLNFEAILEKASEYYRKFPPEKLEQLVKRRVEKELEQRKRDEQLMKNRLNRNKSIWHRINGNLPAWCIFKGKYGLLFAAATVLLGYIYYLRFSEGRHPFKSIFNT
uniref:TBC1 domain family member 20 n=1 Tax=Diabrotica virgifera virgifera TaxID=50390 RepID=A0A6P7EZ45_DIAVI